MLDWIWANKEWLFSGVGVVIITAIVGLSWRFRRIRRPNSAGATVRDRDYLNSHLEGNWYGYYVSWVDDAVEVLSEAWVIRKDRENRLLAETQTLGGRQLSFRGPVDLEKDQFIVRLKAIEHEEEVQCRFKLPIPGHAELIVGLYLGVDFNGRMIVGPHLLSKNPLDDDTVNRTLSDRLKVAPSRRAVRIVD